MQQLILYLQNAYYSVVWQDSFLEYTYKMYMQIGKWNICRMEQTLSTTLIASLF